MLADARRWHRMTPHLLLHSRLISLLVICLPSAVYTMTLSVQVLLREEVGRIVLHIKLLLGRSLLVS